MWYSLSRRRVRAQPYGYLFLRTSFSAFGAFNYKYTHKSKAPLFSTPNSPLLLHSGVCLGQGYRNWQQLQLLGAY